MDNNMQTIQSKKDFIKEIKLYINEKLYKKGSITEEMYIAAKDFILRTT